jgi:biopolymer transport protein ExbD
VSAGPSPTGLGIYFVDVLACLLFCLSLALVGARFGREHTVPVELPRAGPNGAPGPELTGSSLTLREHDGELEVFLDEERIPLEELEARLRAAPPAALVIRSQPSPLARAIGMAHAAGVHDIQLAYRSEEESR